jgi:hypothetical protein
LKNLFDEFILWKCSLDELNFLFSVEVRMHHYYPEDYFLGKPFFYSDFQAPSER